MTSLLLPRHPPHHHAMHLSNLFHSHTSNMTATTTRFPVFLLFLLIGASSAFQSRPSLSNSRTSSALFTLPKLIVFDLDNTLWSPELYQLRKHQRTNQIPIAGKDVKLLKGAQAALDMKQDLPDTKFAVASRTKSVDWAHSLLDQFDIRHLFDHVEIFPGNKRSHFENIQRDSGVKFNEMLFFDDARDGKYGNCKPVSQMGVLSVHCPSGLHSPEIFETGLQRYKEWDGARNTIVEWNGEVTNSGVSVSTSSTTTMSNERQEGVVKMVNHEKGYGFIRYGNGNTQDVFFHFSSMPNDVVVEQGDVLSFTVGRDGKSGKSRAENVELVGANNNSNKKDTVKMHVFSMNQPFAALLANGYKTLETRNGTMFVPYPEGTKMLLHVGRRTYPDGNRHIDVMKSGGLNDDEIEKLKSLPPGFSKGSAVAILEIGKTYETTVKERSDAEFQRNVSAFGEDSGRMVTEIKRAEYLKRPVKVSGQGGVFKADIPKDALPDGWNVSSSNNVPYKTRKEETGKTPQGTRNPSGKGSNSKPVFSISG